MRIASILCGIAATAALTPSASAVDHNNWRTFPLITNAVTAVNNTGTTTSYLSATEAYFYSGVTKQWRSVPISTADFYEHYNAYALVQDGNSLHAFSARTGEIETLVTSAPALIVSGPATSSWMSFAVVGKNAWGFSSFRGEWVPLSLSQPNPNMDVRRLCGLLQDGDTVYGFSAHWGTFVPIAADSQAVIQVNDGGELGVAHSPGMLRGFSANQNTWDTLALNYTGSTYLTEGVALAFSSDTAAGFSSQTGKFATEPIVAAPTTVWVDAMVGAFPDGGDVVCYGAGQGEFRRLAGVTSPSFVTDYHFVLVVEPTRVTPFSSQLSNFGSPIAGTFLVTTNDAIAYAEGISTSAAYAYSPMLNAWTPAPAVTPTSTPAVTRSGVLIPHAAGYEAISARYGTWVSLPIQNSGSFFLAPSNGSAILVHDGPTTAHAFDGRLNRWATIQSTGPLSGSTKRHMAVVDDGVSAWAFSHPTSRWDEVSLHGSSINKLDLSSSTTVIDTGTETHIYCVTGDLSYEGREPEFSRGMKMGNHLRMHQVAPAGSALVTLIALQGDYVDLGPVTGILFLDGGSTIAVSLPVVVPSNGILHLDVPVPEDPALLGLQPHLQNYVVPPTGSPYLSTSVSPFIY